MEIKILTIIGARPQIIKAAAISRTIKNGFDHQIQEILVHTGQHYDANMSDVFFKEMGIPEPHHNLNVGSMSHAAQTAKMMLGIENLINSEKPNYLLVYGDTNSTLAGALSAAKLHLPVIHVEAGLRSYNKSMPEEINRIITDHASTLLFTPTKTGFQNLIKEGFSNTDVQKADVDHPAIFHCGDVMLDNSLFFKEKAQKDSQILQKMNLKPNEFVLCTIHRDNNTDIKERLTNIVRALLEISQKNDIQIVLPLHPRTAKKLPEMLDSHLYQDFTTAVGIKITEPVSFFDMIQLESNSKLIMTDSGGVQKEAFFFKKPCLILRSETEWVEIVDADCAKIVDANREKIIENFNLYLNKQDLFFPDIFGNGKAAEFICQKIIKHGKQNY
ncbi:MAG: UDP-N-acetylglucosamine 2-epimerase (non-hydrolyzing) [Bacteroidales bacterium]|nr:UDP-N-acetylglucosamine 2-epimerase (non-hydrolyzing) [Bacteroidales bacterium]MDY0217297.1 UDP-N-acetylglucosamine 2-epimerase (non-hydrolyzing) [Bacteroidales bacterium]